MRVGIAFDLQPVSGPPTDGPDDRFEEFDKPETVDAIAEVIRGEGHEVVLLGDGRPFLERVLADPPDFVWNIAEGEGVGRCREARVPAALEMLGIPYSGSDPLTLAACLDKGTTHRLLKDWVRMPRGLLCSNSEQILSQSDDQLVEDVLDRLGGCAPDVWDLQKKSLILKPAYEGSSKGIRTKAIVANEADLVANLRELVQIYKQPIMIEEFIAGDEATVAVCGNSNPEVLGVMQIIPRQPEAQFVYSLEVKRDWRNRVRYEAPPRFSSSVMSNLRGEAYDAYVSLGCRDFARLDFRIDAEGRTYLIEVNPLPGLAPVTSDLVILAEGYGLSHADLIRKLFRISLERNGLLR